MVSAEPFTHGTETLQKEMATYRLWSVSLWRDPDDVPHCRILSPDKTEWRLISATLCGWRRCFVADQLWLMTRIREEEEWSMSCLVAFCATWWYASAAYAVVRCPSEWRLISATLCGWRRCFVADQLWLMTRIREEEEVPSKGICTLQTLWRGRFWVQSLTDGWWTKVDRKHVQSRRLSYYVLVEGTTCHHIQPDQNPSSVSMNERREKSCYWLEHSSRTAVVYCH